MVPGKKRDLGRIGINLPGVFRVFWKGTACQCPAQCLVSTQCIY